MYNDEQEAEKLQRFTVAVNEKIDGQIEEILSEAYAEKDNILKTVENTVLQEMHLKIQHQMKEIDTRHRRIRSQALQENKKEILMHREKLSKQIFDNIERRIIEFTDSPEYLKYLCKLLEGKEIKSSMIIRLSERDMKFKDEIAKTMDGEHEFEIDKSIKYGGLSIFDRDTLTIEDRTIDNSLQEEKEQFCYNYSFTVGNSFC
ncbi:MAG: hypothetical protein GX365_00590 [Clostridiales bacterium]|nr:hypothetical protein [Clostridiales bacterium]